MKINTVLVEFEYLEDGVIGYEFLSNNGFTTKSNDYVVPNRNYKELIQDDPYITNGFKEPLTVGNLKLSNDGELDVYMQSRITDSRKIKIWVGNSDLQLAEFMQVFSGTIKKFSFSGNDVEIILSDNKERLNKDIQTNLFPDSSGYPEGIRNTPKPITYGTVFNISPTPIDDTGDNYQFHESTLIDTTLFAYDKGAAVLFDNTGGVFTDGIVNLTESPVGQVTLSISYPSDSDHVKTVEDIFKAIATRVYPAVVFNADSFTAFTDGTLKAGVYLTEKTNAVSFLDDFLFALRACWFFNAAGEIEIMQMSTPKETADFFIDSSDIIDINIENNEDYEVSSSVKIGHYKNWTVQKDSDLVESKILVTYSQRHALAREYLGYSIYENTGIHDTYPSATIKKVEPCYLANTADTNAQAQAWAELCSVPRYTIKVKCDGYTGLTTRQMKLGDTVQVTSNRYGTKKGVVTKITQHFESAIHELELFF